MEEITEDAVANKKGQTKRLAFLLATIFYIICVCIRCVNHKLCSYALFDVKVRAKTVVAAAAVRIAAVTELGRIGHTVDVIAAPA